MKKVYPVIVIMAVLVLGLLGTALNPSALAQGEPDYDLFTLEPSLALDAKGSEQTFEVFYNGVRGFPPSMFVSEVEWVFVPGVNLYTVATLGSDADVIVTEGGKPGIGELPPNPTEPTDGNDDFVTILLWRRGDCHILLLVNGMEVASAEAKWGELYRSVLDVDADTPAVDHEVWEDTNICELISETVTATYLEAPGPQPAGEALVHWWLVEDSEENQDWIRDLMNYIATTGVDGYVDDWTATGHYLDPFNNPYDQIMEWAGLNQPSHTYWSDCPNPAFNPMDDQWIEYEKVNGYYGWSTTMDNMPYQDHGMAYATLSNAGVEDVLIVTLVEYQMDFHGENLILIQIGKKHFVEPLESIPRLLKQDAISNLEVVEPTKKKAQRLIDSSIRSISRSLSERLWVDDLHLCSTAITGALVFDMEKMAVLGLKEAGKIDPTIGYAVGAAIDKLTKADKLLSVTAIADAKSVEVKDPLKKKIVDREIARAEEQLDKACGYLEKDMPAQAITHFKLSWMHAQTAIKVAQTR